MENSDSKNEVKLGIDIGGTLAKLAILYDRKNPDFDYEYVELDGGK
jgi:pantothenate kinase